MKTRVTVHVVVHDEWIKGWRQRVENSIDLCYQIQLGSKSLQFVDITHHPETMFVNLLALGHLHGHELFQDLLSSRTILLFIHRPQLQTRSTLFSITQPSACLESFEFFTYMS
ncbi:hypothetical protein AWY89_10665 [Pasteurella multocida subsp. multocida]|nr:hypothetical protein AWY89_10665 [Pasteurella multocida subsp. multocida]